MKKKKSHKKIFRKDIDNGFFDYVKPLTMEEFNLYKSSIKGKLRRWYYLKFLPMLKK